MTAGRLIIAAALVAAVATFPVQFESLPYFPRNVISVPDNCPPGQALVSSQCRDIWKLILAHAAGSRHDVDNTNVISVPDNCPDGEELINGECREVWRSGQPLKIAARPLDNDISNQNVITVPPNCPSGTQLVNGQCREIWRIGEPVPYSNDDVSHQNVITVPPNCPSGTQLVNGQCREIWRSGEPMSLKNTFLNSNDHVSNQNVITVPPNCPSGTQLVNGECREIWRSGEPRPLQVATPMYINNVPSNQPNVYDAPSGTLKNIVTVPNQCPDGYRPDSAGVCREIW